jgi:predicted nucleic acid-binding protein
MIILDSNIWIAYLNKNDSQHRKAVSIFSKIKEDVLVTEYIILEVATVLSMRVDKKIADNFINLIRSNQDIEVFSSSENFFNKTLGYFLEYQKGNLSFVDISLLALSKNYQVFTFDEDLKKEIKTRNGCN